MRPPADRAPVAARRDHELFPGRKGSRRAWPVLVVFAAVALGTALVVLAATALSGRSPVSAVPGPHEGGTAGRPQVTFSSRPRVLTVGGVARPIAVILTDEESAFSDTLAVTPSAHMVDVWLFNYPRTEKDGSAFCKIEFLPAKGARRTLLTNVVPAGQSTWLTKRIDLAEYEGRSGHMIVSAASPQGERFRVFVGLGQP